MKLLVLCLSALAAHGAVDNPRVGCLLHPDGTLRQVLGVRGNFIVSSPVASEVLSFSCADGVVLAKTAALLLAFDAEGTELARVDVAPGAASFDGVSAMLEDQTAFRFDVRERAWQRLEERPKDAPPVPFTIRDGVLYAGGTEPVAVPGEVRRIERMSAHWFHAVSSEGHFALNTSGDEPEVFALPIGNTQ